MAWVAACLALACGLMDLSAQDPDPAPKPMIPDLPWVPRSDWINVKTGVTPAAVGDGVADDTAALQAALDRVVQGTTIYLPPGKYRITKTLDFNRPRPSGVAIIGNGRSTIISWDGDTGGRMLWVHGGEVCSKYVGLTWDGNNKAAVGIDHAANTFETEITHLDEAFLNFVDTGLRIGNVDPKADGKEPRFESAEIEYNNCLFENCKIGTAALQFNDYDNTYDGCEFRRCGIGIKNTHGNLYARDTHFEDSSEVDLFIACEHSSSVRRCTSSGSNRFIDWENFVPALAVQDCHVTGWKADAAILLNGGPVMIFDCSFEHPVGSGMPVRVGGADQRLVLSNNTSGGPLLDDNTQGHVVKIPNGKQGGVIQSATQSFLTSTATMPTKIFDAKVDYEAKGDGVTDDSDAVQRTINAARDYGQGAMAYFPTGVYMVQRTIKVSGANYTVAGSGFRSCLLWRGDRTGTIMEVTDPDHVTLQDFNVGSHDVGPMDCDMDIHQTSTGGNSFMTYDHVDVFGMYQRKPDIRGLVCTGLSAGSVVHIRHVEGNLRFTDAAQATILADTSYEGSVTVSGEDKQRDGILAFQMRLSTVSTYGVIVHDNQSIVMTDYYVEQADNGCIFQGGADDPDGHVIIQGAKMQTNTGPMTIDNYGGTIFMGPDQYYLTPKPVVFAIGGTRPLDLFLVSSTFYNTSLDLQKGNDQAHVYLVGNDQKGTTANDKDEINDHFPASAGDTAADMLDIVRRVGQLDLQLNYPTLTPSPTKP